jgi:RNA polymerase sigma factor (sigma-70 family)
MSELALPIQSPSELALAGRLSSDERLARLVSRGSERAFAVLYRRHHQALYRYCLSIVRDEDDAQDALQSAMTRALVALRAQERDLAVRPWLFRIAHNEAVSVLRRRRPTTPLAEGLEPADGGVERTLEGRERLATLLADLQALPVRQRSALVMRELSGLSIEEIAGALSTSPGAAKQVLFEARRALHEFAEGRAMECEQARRSISDGDRRVLRGRRLRGHLRACAGCRDFQVAISLRGADLRALAPPLPGVLAAGMLGRLLAHGLGGGGHAGAVTAGSGAALGASAGASLTAKTLVGLTALTVAAAGGTHLALVHHGSHGHPRSGAGPGARLAHSGPAGASASVLAARRLAGSGGSAAPAVDGHARAATQAVPARPIAVAGVPIGPRSDARASDEARAGANHLAHARAGIPQRTRGHGGSASSRHGGPHRSRVEGKRGHRSGSSRPQHGAGAKHEQAPTHPVTSKAPHAHGRGESNESAGAPSAEGTEAQQQAGAPVPAPALFPLSRRHAGDKP